jgi:hypothetical protein
MERPARARIEDLGDAPWLRTARCAARILRTALGLVLLGCGGGELARDDSGPQVWLASLQVGEEYAADEVRRGLAWRALRRCYLESLRAEPKRHGKATLTWTIGGGGWPEGVELRSSSTLAPELDRCVLQAVQRSRFRKPGSRSQPRVEVSLVFAPRADLVPARR